jgi:hypothetical protein
MVFEVLLSALAERLNDAIVGVNYGTPKLPSRLRIAHNGIHRVHQPRMNL